MKDNKDTRTMKTILQNLADNVILEVLEDENGNYLISMKPKVPRIIMGIVMLVGVLISIVLLLTATYRPTQPAQILFYLALFTAIGIIIAFELFTSYIISYDFANNRIVVKSNYMGIASKSSAYKIMQNETIGLTARKIGLFKTRHYITIASSNFVFGAFAKKETAAWLMLQLTRKQMKEKE